LSGLPESISVDSGGKQQLELRRGMHEPFSLYWIFGSASGTTPGLVVDGVPLPLNFDAYYLFLALNPNTVVDPTIGILDGIGSALPRIELPPLDPTLVGATLHHVALTFDLSNGPIVEFASNPVPLRFTTEADLVPQDFESGVDGWTLAAPVGGASWQLVQDGDCGAVTRMLAYTSAPPTCGGDLVAAISNARSMSPIFRLGQVGSYELRLTSMLTAGLDARIRLFLPGPPAVYFELAWPSDFTDTGALETLAFPVPGIEYAIGRDARFEFLLNGTPNSSPAGWWIDDVELVKLP
jgi:hypothetical protein